MTNAPLPQAAQRLAAAAAAKGISVEIREMPASTRTAEEAAQACGCVVAQIVKSLVFRGAETNKPYLLLFSGANRVNEKAVAATIGEALTRPDATYVRELTGYAIGGIPPFGHATSLATYIDRDLLAFDEVWAAAGTPNCVMRLTPEALKDAASATELVVR
jgi:prolyl-tRNA editing enzyme YbaK/EbsC (Cys-tRNA(Pro) deacylase)